MRLGLVAPVALGLFLSACGSSASRVPTQSGIPGTEILVPGGMGATFFVDSNVNGEAASFAIAELLFGRLVDIHDVDGNGMTNETPIFVDFLVEQDLLGSVSYRLESNPLTGRERLVVLIERAVNLAGFNTLLEEAADGLVSVVARSDSGLDPGPFSSIPRNSSISIRFNDMLNDDVAAAAALNDNVKMLVGNLPSQPYFSRVRFDPNHGALLGDAFHSTRVLIDMAVSVAESSASGGAIAANTVGLPAGDNTLEPNVSIRIPTRTVPAGQAGAQLTILRSVGGTGLDSSNNGPVRNNATLDVVRAFRPNNGAQANNGFMPDIVAPELLGSWAMTVGAASNDAGGTATFDFLLNLQFDSACRSAMEVGDLLEMGTNMLLVTAAAAPDMAGSITGLQVRSLSAIANPASLVGAGFFVSPLDPTLVGIDGCWVGFSPLPITPITGTGPVAGIATTANLTLRFSEPMDPGSMSVLDGITLVAGTAATQPDASNRVAGSYVPTSPALESFTLVHPLPFAHQTGVEDAYTLASTSTTSATSNVPTDLAGNAMLNLLPATEFTINMTDAATANRSLILRFDRTYQEDDLPGTPNRNFSGINEVDDPLTSGGDQIKADYAGAFSSDIESGELRGREVMFQSFVIDSTQPTVANMLGLGVFGVAPPLNRLGSKTQTLWRLFDMGMFSNEPSTMNVDVMGLNWAPVNGVVTRDFYPNFEIRLGTSDRLPEESVNSINGSLNESESGLDPTMPFSNSVLGGGNKLVTVHERTKGYTVRAIDRFNSTTGLALVPFPLNQGLAPGEALSTYTWRDSGNLDTSDQLIDVPTLTDVGSHVVPNQLPAGNLESERLGAIHTPADPKQAAVMPLLMEFNCFATSNAIGTNLFTVGFLAPGVDPSFKPFSRIYSEGGINILGFPQSINPDASVIPTGGFNPGAGGSPTPPGDNVYYLGQLDTVVRVTRLVTHWIDLLAGPIGGPLAFAAPIIEPAQNTQPLGTSILLAYRSATSFTANANRAFDPAFQGPNGDPVNHLNTGDMHNINFQSVSVLNNTVDGQIWNPDITEMKSRYLQVRITFVNNIDSMATPVLSALAFPFDL